MKKTIFILIVFYFAVGQSQESIDDQIKDIFGNVPTKPTLARNSSNTQDCKCVPYYMCNDTSSINTNGVGIIDIRDDNVCESYLDVCCKNSNQISESITPRPQGPRRCGYRNVDGVGFRIQSNENESQFGEFPWMVAIVREQLSPKTNETLNVYTCGGALIHPQAVLTSAHCVATLERYKVRAGEWDTQTKKELYPHQDRFVRNIVIHRDYSPKNLINDIAILFLESPVNLAEHINTICIPEENLEMPSGTRCFATGWGKDVHGKKGKYHVILKKVDVPMVDHATCQVQFRNSPLGPRFHLHRSFVCAGEKQKDTCDGDGGSPLVCPVLGKENTYQHVGMVAWGAGCGEYGTPGVYVNVGLYRDWIEKYLSIFGLNLAQYQ